MPSHERDLDQKVERIASNAWFMVVGRTAMILTIPILGYFGTQMGSMQTELKVLSVIVDNQGVTMKAATADIYRSADAVRDSRLTQTQIDDVKRRLDLMERARENPSDHRK